MSEELKIQTDMYAAHLAALREHEEKLTALLVEAVSMLRHVQVTADAARQNLRDHFAVSAMNGILASTRDYVGASSADELAAIAYEYADALLVERDKDVTS